MSIRTFYTVVFLVTILAAVTFSVIGCSKEKRHDILTFFIDGVPPVGGWDPNDPNSPNYRKQRRTAEGAAQEQLTVSGSRHKSGKECEFCHGEDSIQKYSGSMPLVEKEPDLCYNCHTDYTKKNAYVHGPVAVGECLFCHQFHRSKNRHLLKKPIPELCYMCHDEIMIEQIPDHRPELLGKCNFCHNPHSGERKGLLKMNSRKGTRLDYKFSE